MIELAWGAHSDRGLRRALNEDACLAQPPLFLVADGMGGHASGDKASAAAISAFAELSGRPSVSLEDVEQAFARAVHDVTGIDSRGDAGTTISGVAVSEQDGGTYWLVLNIGDSRTYRLSNGVFEQISVDHSEVQELVDRGELSAADAERHPRRNVITKAVGAGSSDMPDYWLLPVRDRDRILVCSDGLSKELSSEQLANVLAEEASAQGAAVRLVHEALIHGGRDNVTAVVVDAIRSGEPDDDDTATYSFDENTVPRPVAEEERTPDAPLQLG
ncbi:protein phosphatase 2C domain-containing protein [Sinomonas sp. JGH33]|uniref:Protein phosphatase 2C domain-containing protein n=1 Tax=Sinomonas terricola TaxID=3110330 RepID=A0ABU5T9L9_9MICC|nr:protein phosphatase 2C domain-containing protein [Sinomonas sp. JGH33]MEA5456393.1 protein phosphatase 2C domain-containing protein [Sinomonas sp. JGH33]